ncbi:protoglobin domain-containing protein [Roseibium sp.]|uniref:protoglobin domain-containing protein n=1 Tax=Roseibium sp. TaxID=1936156 RepID=UPI003A96D09A
MSDDGILNRVRFFKLSSEDYDTARSVWPFVKSNLKPVLEAFYAHVETVPHLAGLVGQDQSRLMAAQERHWENLFTSGVSADYVESAQRIGLAHVRIGLDPTWYIGGYSFFLSRLISLFQQKYRFSSGKSAKVLQSVTRLIMLDMDVAISTYHDRMIADAEAREEGIRQAIQEFDGVMGAAMTSFGSASNDMALTSEHLLSAATDINQRMSRMEHSSGETANGVQSGAAATEEMTSSIEEIGRQAAMSSSVAQKAVDGALKTNRSVQELAEVAEKVGSVIGLISEIAEQTNLLALNATIEAARAGEMGRGFAVVASEVKELAGQTTKATEEITDQIAAIQRATRQSVHDIEEITETINQVSEIATNIASAVEEQTVAASEISQNVQIAATGARDFSREIVAVRASLGESERSAGKVSEMSCELKNHADRLEQEARTFFSKVQGR